MLRELRGIWRKAVPLPSQLVINAANALGILPGRIKDKSQMLEVLMEEWRADGMKSQEFTDFEAALVRYGKALRKTHDGSRLSSGRTLLDEHGK